MEGGRCHLVDGVHARELEDAAVEDLLELGVVDEAILGDVGPRHQVRDLPLGEAKLRREQSERRTGKVREGWKAMEGDGR